MTDKKIKDGILEGTDALVLIDVDDISDDSEITPESLNSDWDYMITNSDCVSGPIFCTGLTYDDPYIEADGEKYTFQDPFPEIGSDGYVLQDPVFGVVKEVGVVKEIDGNYVVVDLTSN